MADPDPPRIDPSRADSVEKLMGEELILRFLDLPLEQWNEVYASICRRHPEHGVTIGDRLHGLLGAGLMPHQGPLAPLEADAPRRFGPYSLLRKLGTGGQGIVWLAEDTRLGRSVALKVLGPAAALSDHARERLRREAALVAKLDHPCICTVYEIGDVEGTPYIAMRYVDGEPLASIVARARATAGDAATTAVFPPGPTPDAGSARTSGGAGSTRASVLAIVRLFERIARTLHVAHEAGIVHRDIKPGNLLVRRDGEPTILDFGLAREEGGDALTGTGDVLGTPAYMSPEQLQHHPLDRRTDVFSLAVTLYECLTLRLPFGTTTREALFRAILQQDPPRPRRFNPHVPQDLEIVLETALDKNRDRRYQTALDFAEDLAAVRESRPIRARPVSWLGRATRWARRQPIKAALVIALLILVPAVAALGGFLVASWPDLEAQRLLQRDQRVEATLEAGFVALNESRLDESRGAFEDALRLDPERIEAAVGMTMLLRQQGGDATLAWLDGHPRLEERENALGWLRAEALRDAGRTDEAEAIEARLGAPASSLDLLFCGLREAHRVERGEGSDSTRAVQLLTDAVLRTRTPQPIYHIERGLAAQRAGDAVAALQSADALEALWPNSMLSWYASSRIRYGIDPDGALVAARRAVELGPDVAAAHNVLGIALITLGDPATAAASFRRAIELEPTLVEANGNLGSALKASGDPSGARDALQHALELRPEWAVGHYNLGTVYVDLEDFAAAEASFRRAIENQPGFGVSHLNLGVLLNRRGQHDAALAELEQAAALLPGSAIAHYNLGETRAGRGDVEGSITALRRAAELAERDPGLLAKIARALFLDDARDDAISVAERALRASETMEPPNPALRAQLEAALAEYRGHR